MSILRRLSDGLANLMTGHGTSADKRMHSVYLLRLLDPAQIDAMYRSSWLMRKGVDLPPYDMTRAGRDWKADKAAIARLEAGEKRLQLWPKLRRALQLGRLGGGAMIIGADGAPEQPLGPKPSIRYLHVVSRYQISLGQLISDPEDPFFGEPEYWELTSGRIRARIHPSRVIAFRGVPHSDMLGTWGSADAYWGDSVLQAVYEAVQNADMAQGGFASLIDEAKVDVIRMPDLMTNAASEEYEARFLKRLELAQLGKSIHRAMVLDKDEEWEQRQVTWNGMPDIIRTYLAIVAGAFDIPATRLLGKAPDGMNATGEGDERNYWTMISSRQDSDLRPALDRLDPALRTTAGVGEDAYWEFAPLTVLTETEKADVDKKKAETVNIYATTGLIPMRALEEAVQNMVVEDGLLPGLDQILDELPEDERFPSQGADDGTDPSAIVDPRTGEEVINPPRRRVAANDAVPRSLYVQRKLLNADEFIRWAKSQGFETTTPAEDLHVTIAFSRQALDWMKVGESWSGEKDGGLTVKAGGARLVEPLGDKGAVVLLFNSSELSWRHEEIKRAGASFDFDEFQPHVTITYQAPADLDLSKVEPFRGELRFGPEIFDEVVEDWERGLVEDGGGPNADVPFGDGKRRRRSGGGARHSSFDPTQPRDRAGRWIPSGRRATIDDAMNGSTTGKQVFIGKVGRKADALARRSGFDISDKAIALDRSAIRHIALGHGRERRAGHRDVTGRDIASAHLVLNGASRLRAAGSARTGAPRFATMTKMGGDRVFAVFEVRKKAVSLVTMWIRG